MVTAEAAMALPGVVAVLGLLLWGLAVGVTQVRCVAAARGAALASARGEPADEVAARVVTAVGRRATLTVHRSGRDIRAEVRAPVGGGWLPARVVTATAHAVSEPAADDGASVR